MRYIVPTVFFALCACAAQAGPWPREKGVVFTAFGGNFLLSEGAQLPVNYDPTFYGEYGLNGTVTFGVDYHTADLGRIQAAVFFASFPLGEPVGPDVFSAQIGLGARMDPLNPVEHLLRGGVSWGRGLDSGWMAIDASATYGDIDQLWRPKADFTWGHHLNDRWSVMAQLQTGQGYDDDTYAKVNPAVIFHINDRYSVSIGAVHALTGDRGSALKLDLWTTATIPRFHATE
ncbi:hypothetical protein SAMN04488005_2227 [Yoonia tamlensis]|uniref:MetA-pathway of phenol degradation n=1 Tax=Yoonia tamlensis TaxID=390270 RepID=A0A1I6GVQ7_9RHOB|nr:hypothetical protein [Yoonia tamlensis]SFR46236.1 hypothetical protein SAMN04488005_2227 [Yoonia tamlensis]